MATRSGILRQSVTPERLAAGPIVIFALPDPPSEKCPTCGHVLPRKGKTS